MQVQHVEGRYTIRMQARLDAPAAAAYAAFTDYERLPRINPAVRQVSRRVGAAPGMTRLATQVRVCVAFYCRSFQQVQDMRPFTVANSYGLQAQVLPEHSDLRYGKARWLMSPCGNGSCLEFSAALEPAFWVPPLIGPWLIQRALRTEAEITAEGIERVVRETR